MVALNIKSRQLGVKAELAGKLTLEVAATVHQKDSAKREKPNWRVFGTYARLRVSSFWAMGSPAVGIEPYHLPSKLTFFKLGRPNIQVGNVPFTILEYTVKYSKRVRFL
jgi:hypothetical protein